VYVASSISHKNRHFGLPLIIALVFNRSRMPYLIEEHKHRYASWSASRASSVKGCRFTVLQGKMLLEKIDMLALVNDPDKLPTSNKMDEKHNEWRLSIISEAKKWA